MSTRHERETLAALEKMGGTARPRGSGEAADLAPSPSAAATSAAGTSACDAAPLHRCLSCGYPLKILGDTRCSECGARLDSATLSRWFSGDEERRLEQVLWLIRLALGLKLLLFPTVIGYYWERYPSVAWIGSVAAAAWMLWFSMRGRIGERGSRYAIIGLHLAAVLLWMELRGFSDDSPLSYSLPTSYALLDSIVGLLLLISLFQRDGITLPGWRHVLWTCGIALMVLPILAFIGSRLLAFGGLLSLDKLMPNTINSFGHQLVAWIGYVFNLGVWGFVWWRISRLHRALFGGRESAVA